VQTLYALISGLACVTLRHRLSAYKGRVPHGMLPIGDDPAGNLYLMDLSPGERYGRIYFWDHEIEADDEGQSHQKNITLISNSFIEFLVDLY